MVCNHINHRVWYGTQSNQLKKKNIHNHIWLDMAAIMRYRYGSNNAVCNDIENWGIVHNHTSYINSMVYKFCSTAKKILNLQLYLWNVIQSHYTSYVYGTAFSHVSSLLYSLISYVSGTGCIYIICDHNLTAMSVVHITVIARQS